MDFLKNLIAKNGVVVLSKTYCPYCTKAKKLLDAEHILYTVVELDTRADGTLKKCFIKIILTAKNAKDQPYKTLRLS